MGHEADQLVGALAALVATARFPRPRLGFLGGMKTPVIEAIEAAFWAGARAIAPDLIDLRAYVGSFDNPDQGYAAAQMLYDSGAYVLYQAAGGSGLGAIRAARERDALIISTGGDHLSLAPNAVLTSRIKHVDHPVRDVITAVMEDRFVGGAVGRYGFAGHSLTLAGLNLPLLRGRLARPGQYEACLAQLKALNQQLTQGQLALHLAGTGPIQPPPATPTGSATETAAA